MERGRALRAGGRAEVLEVSTLCGAEKRVSISTLCGATFRASDPHCVERPYPYSVDTDFFVVPRISWAIRWQVFRQSAGRCHFVQSWRGIGQADMPSSYTTPSRGSSMPFQVTA